MAESPDERVDRYIDGDLSAAEQRQLAQSALDDPALFDTLTAAALLKQTARDEAEPASLAPTTPPIRHHPSRTRVALLVGGAMAAAAVLALVVVYRSSSTTNGPDSLEAQRQAGSAPAQSRSASANLHPTILIARLTESNGAATPEFRSLERGGRGPKVSGLVTSSADGEIEIDLGSLDGIAKGSIVQTGGGTTEARSGTVTVTTVFRERSRARVSSGSAPRVGDRADVAPDVHVAALSEHVAARAASGETASARALAAQAAEIVTSRGVTSGAGRLALYQAAVLDHANGLADNAVRYLRLAAAQFDAAPAATGEERARILSALGAALIAQDNDVEAERTLRLAQPIATGRVGVHVANNLAALAARRGDRAAADSLYRSALAQAGNEPGLEAERRTIQSNIDALTASR